MVARVSTHTLLLRDELSVFEYIAPLEHLQRAVHSRVVIHAVVCCARSLLFHAECHGLCQLHLRLDFIRFRTLSIHIAQIWHFALARCVSFDD